jgi:hypothetical protein
MRRALAGALTAVALLGSFGLGWIGAPASATDPLAIDQQITDEAGVLGNRQPEVQRALDRFFERTGDRLYVAYVPSFDSATPAEWAAATAEKSDLGPTAVFLVFATKTRAFGHAAADPKYTAAGLDAVDRNQIRPALRNDDYAKATIDAAEAYGDLAEARPLPWAWIVSGIGVALVALLVWVRRSRSRFEHTHHVLDEHGNPVDPADILTLEEIDRASAAALVAVDDALLTSATDVAHAAKQRGDAAVQPFAAVVTEGRAAIDDAFRRRRKLDNLIAKGRSDEQSERKTRKRASRILAVCEQVDAALDAGTAEFDRMRDLRPAADGLLDELAPQVAAATDRVASAKETYALLPTRAAAAVEGNLELAENLLRAATRQLKKRRDAAPVRLRAIEDALVTATELIDEVAAAETHPSDDDSLENVRRRVEATERFVASRRGAVGVRARVFRSEARRQLTVAQSGEADPEVATTSLRRAAEFADLGLQAAREDVAAWLEGREASDDPFSRKFDALVLAGILVDETDSGGLKTLLGGSSHGGGSGAPYRGIEHEGTLRTPGCYGGTTTRGRWGGF